MQPCFAPFCTYTIPYLHQTTLQKWIWLANVQLKIPKTRRVGCSKVLKTVENCWGIARFRVADLKLWPTMRNCWSIGAKGHTHQLVAHPISTWSVADPTLARMKARKHRKHPCLIGRLYTENMFCCQLEVLCNYTLDGSDLGDTLITRRSKMIKSSALCKPNWEWSAQQYRAYMCLSNPKWFNFDFVNDVMFTVWIILYIYIYFHRIPSPDPLMTLICMKICTNRWTRFWVFGFLGPWAL